VQKIQQFILLYILRCHATFLCAFVILNKKITYLLTYLPTYLLTYCILLHIKHSLYLRLVMVEIFHQVRDVRR